MSTDNRSPDQEGRVENRYSEESNLLAYFISISCYGSRLPGDPRGTVDDDHNTFDTPLKPGNEVLLDKSRKAMNQDPYSLDRPRRDLVLTTIREVCEHREWILMAAHVRATHFHTVVHGNQSPERMGTDFKAYASRNLNDAGFDHRNRKRWARHQSNPYLWDVDVVQAAIRYTLHSQGEQMQTFVHPEFREYNFREYRHEIDVELRKFFRKHGMM